MPRVTVAIVSTLLALTTGILPAMAVTPTTKASSSIEIVGKIEKVGVEGGCYRLVTTQGKNYELIGKYPKIEGAKLKVRGKVATDTATICQVGQPFKVESVKSARSK
jgi:hypothetical protein